MITCQILKKFKLAGDIHCINIYLPNSPKAAPVNLDSIWQVQYERLLPNKNSTYIGRPAGTSVNPCNQKPLLKCDPPPAAFAEFGKLSSTSAELLPKDRVTAIA